MTLCVGSISHSDRAVVAVADSMITTGHGLTADNAALKQHSLHPLWFAMFAGNNVGNAGPVCRGAARRLAACERPSIDDVRHAMEDAYADEWKRAAELAVLKSFGIASFDAFSKGAATLRPELLREVEERLRELTLECDFLVFGFDGLDPAGYPHVFTVENGAAVDFFPMGWWAIGSGANLAIAALSHWKHSWEADVATTLYRLLEARFFAEKAEGVGDERTFAVILRPSSNFVIVPEATIRAVREWWRTKMRIIPPESIELLRDALTKEVRGFRQDSKRDSSGQPPSPESAGGSDGS